MRVQSLVGLAERVFTKGLEVSMRCLACDCNLSDVESVLRHPETNEFLDLCSDCIIASEIVPKSQLRKMIRDKEHLNESNLEDNDSL